MESKKDILKNTIKELPLIDRYIKKNLLNITENIGEEKMESTINILQSIGNSLLEIEKKNKDKIKKLIENFVYDYLHGKEKNKESFEKKQKLIKQLEVLQQEEKQDVENILDKLSLI